MTGICNLANSKRKKRKLLLYTEESFRIISRKTRRKANIFTFLTIKGNFKNYVTYDPDFPK